MSVGEQLKQARTALQLSLKHVSQTTKIQGWVLEALEADHLHTTMSSVYVRGFVATYAKLVRLDPQPLLAQLYPPAPVMEIAQGSGLRAQGTCPQPPAPSPQPYTGVTSIELPWAAFRRLAIGAMGVAALWALVLVNPMKHLKLQLPHREASLAVPKEPVRAPAPTAVGAVAIAPAQALELTIQARHDTWVSVRADGRLLAQQHLQGGSKESWKARRRLELVVAKPAQVEATLNGRSISPFVMAHQGRLVITHQQIKPLTESAPRVSTAQATR
jgi:cytoskeleton protein RodZ